MHCHCWREFYKSQVEQPGLPQSSQIQINFIESLALTSIVNKNSNNIDFQAKGLALHI